MVKILSVFSDYATLFNHGVTVVMIKEELLSAKTTSLPVKSIECIIENFGSDIDLVALSSKDVVAVENLRAILINCGVPEETPIRVNRPCIYGVKSRATCGYVDCLGDCEHEL